MSAAGVVDGLVKLPVLTAELAALFARLAAVTALAPRLSATELRPLIESLEGRRRTCEWIRCGRRFLVGARHHRLHSFCSDACRMANYRYANGGGLRNGARKVLTMPKPMP